VNAAELAHSGISAAGADLASTLHCVARVAGLTTPAFYCSVLQSQAFERAVVSLVLKAQDEGQNSSCI